MEWINGFTKVKNGFMMEVVNDATGKMRLASLSGLRAALPSPRGTRFVISDARLDALVEEPPQRFLDLIGFHGHASERHAVYVLQREGLQLLIPAGVLALALFRRVQQLSQWLLAPASLDRLAVPNDARGGKVTFFPGALSGGRDIQWATSRFLWFTCFPSARALWSSVHSNACAGKLAVSMPKAIAHVAGCGLSRGGAVLVTRLVIDDVQPLELPLPCARRLAGATFSLGIKREAPKTLADTSLQALRPGPVSDLEWLHIKACLVNGVSASTRHRLDEVLAKLCSGCAWKDVSDSCAAPKLYSRLVRTGRWDRVRAVLVESRTKGLAAPYTRPKWLEAWLGKQPPAPL